MIKYFVFAIGILFLMPFQISAQNLTAKDTANVQFINSRKFFIYKVEKGETLFSISQKFKIPKEEIIQFNKEIEKEGLKVKMKLWIPAYSWLKKDAEPAAETVAEDHSKARYSVAIVTSLNLPKIYTSQDTSGSYIDEPIKRETKDNLEFAEGALHAAEVLKGSKLKVHLFVIDSESDSVKLISKLKKHKDVDLIITNENGNLLKAISSYSQKASARLFSCGINTSETIRNNPNAFSLLPSSTTQCEQMGEFAGRYFTNSTPLIIKTSVYKENERSELFKSGWLKVKEKHFTLVEFQKGEGTAVADCLVKENPNVVFVSSSNEDFVSSVLTALKSRIPEHNVSVIGLPTWQYFETIDQKLIEVCNVHLFSSGFIDYNNPDVINFRKFFRDTYNTEPSEVSYQGYDAMFVAGKLFLSNGVKMISDEKEPDIKGIYSDYKFFRDKSGIAYENQNIHVFQPAQDIAVDLIKNIKP